MDEHFETCSKKGRGMARRSLDLIEAMYARLKPHTRSPAGGRLAAHGGEALSVVVPAVGVVVRNAGVT